MRHRYNKLKYLETWVVKKQLVVRNLLTSLVKNWEVKTTLKRAKILKSVADKFFNRAKKMFDRYEDNQVLKKQLLRLANMYLTDDKNAKRRFIEVIVPSLRDVNFYTGFVSDYRLGFRKWDNSEVVLVKLKPELLTNINSKDVVENK